MSSSSSTDEMEPNLALRLRDFCRTAAFRAITADGSLETGHAQFFGRTFVYAAFKRGGNPEHYVFELWSKPDDITFDRLAIAMAKALGYDPMTIQHDVRGIEEVDREMREHLPNAPEWGYYTIQDITAIFENVKKEFPCMCNYVAPESGTAE